MEELQSIKRCIPQNLNLFYLEIKKKTNSKETKSTNAGERVLKLKENPKYSCQINTELEQIWQFHRI